MLFCAGGCIEQVRSHITGCGGGVVRGEERGSKWSFQEAGYLRIKYALVGCRWGEMRAFFLLKEMSLSTKTSTLVSCLAVRGGECQFGEENVYQISCQCL